MPPRVTKKNAGTTAQKKTGAKSPSKSPKTPAKPMSSTPGKPEPEAVEKAKPKPSPTVEALKAVEKSKSKPSSIDEAPKSVEKAESKPSPTVEAPKAVETFQDLNKPSIEPETEKEIPADYNEGEDKEPQDGPAEINVVVGDQSDGDESADGAGCHEDSVKRDRGDEQHDVEMPALAKERIKQKEFEVFVGGLDKDADEEDLKKLFSEVGDVVDIRLAKNPQNRKNRGFGFVRFATVEQARKAVAELKNPQVRGKPCEVTRNQGNETLHVRNICKSWTKEALEKKLKEYGLNNIEEITGMQDPQHEGTNKGFAFLEFPTHREATNALKRLQKRDVFFGVDICAKVEFAKSGVEPDEEVMAQVKSIFVDGLPPSWDEERVQEKFRKYGEIEKVELARNMPTAKRNDFGFISFTTREAALACIEGVNKNEVNEEDKKVTLKATLRKPQEIERSVKDGLRAGYGGSRRGRAPWVRGVGDFEPRSRGARDSRFGVHQGRRFLNDRHQQGLERAYDRRPPGPAYVPSDSRRNYREEDSYLDRRVRTSARSSYQDDYGYHGAQYFEGMPTRRPSYSEDSYSHRMNGQSSYNDEPARDYAGASGSKRPYSDVGDDLPYPGRHSRSRLDYNARAADSRYGGASRLGQDPQLGYGAGSRANGIYSSDYMTSGYDIGGGPYPARNAMGGYGRGSGSASYY